jgi:hypothetical protein
MRGGEEEKRADVKRESEMGKGKSVKGEEGKRKNRWDRMRKERPQ